MGGNALKNCHTKRLNADEYRVVVDRVVKDIKQTLGLNRKVHPVVSYFNKKDFGDADIIMESNDLPANWVDQLAHVWDSKETFANGDVVSFEVDEFQVDVIKSTPESFDFAYRYFAYNDLGNLLGRMVKKLGLKYGHDGLWYVFRDGDQVVENILVTRDPEMVYDLLWLDKRVVTEPPHLMELEDIFKFVSSSSYFHPDIYLLQNLNHISRTRDRKRKTYMEFLKWCEANRYSFGEPYKFEEPKEVYLPYLFEFFKKENFREKWHDALCKQLMKRHLKDKFNGMIVYGITGLQGKELGMFMQWFLSMVPDDFVAVIPKDKILEEIGRKFEEWKQIQKV